MSGLLISGGNKLKGDVFIKGAKNSILPILAATILCDDECIIHSCPRFSDVEASLKILSYLGAKVKREKDTLIINTRNIEKNDIPDNLMREMRSSVIFLGALVSRMKSASMCLPGGCELGPRPIDLHLNALNHMGMKIKNRHGKISCTIGKKFKGSEISLSFPSVGATENILLASCLSCGKTIINNAAREPEICDLARFLNSCGARIYGAGEGTITVDGVSKICGTEYSVIPDRISAATFLSCAAVTQGEITLHNVVKEHLDSVIPLFEEAGCKFSVGQDTLNIKAPDRLLPIEKVSTMPYPGFPTDAQPILMAMTTLANGTSVFVENIFESRYKHVDELIRMGAKIKVESKVAVVEGVDKLYGASVKGKDLRGTAALVIAGLAAEKETEVSGLSYLDRGYENLEEILLKLGAKIARI